MNYSVPDKSHSSYEPRLTTCTGHRQAGGMGIASNMPPTSVHVIKSVLKDTLMDLLPQLLLLPLPVHPSIILLAASKVAGNIASLGSSLPRKPLILCSLLPWLPWLPWLAALGSTTL